MIKPSEITWDDVVRVGAGTLGGEYLRCFWWPVALAEEVKDIPVPVKLLGEELVLFHDLSGRLTLLGAHSLEGLNLKIDPVRKELVPAGPVITAAAA